MNRLSRYVWPATIIVSGAATALMSVSNTPSLVRAPIAIWFLSVCPGMAYAPLLRVRDRLSEWTIAIALSIALSSLVSLAMLYAGFWSPDVILGVLLALCAIGVALQISVSSIQ